MSKGYGVGVWKQYIVNSSNLPSTFWPQNPEDLLMVNTWEVSSFYVESKCSYDLDLLSFDPKLDGSAPRVMVNMELWCGNYTKFSKIKV